MYNVLTSPLSFLALSIIAYQAAVWINKKVGSPLANPLLIATIFVGVIIFPMGISLDTYNTGGYILNLCLTPATISLALPIYRQLELLKKNILPVIIGAFCGSMASIISVVVIGKALGLDKTLIRSLMPKSVTTPIGMALSGSMGGIEAVASLAICITGLFGALCLPEMLKIFGIKSPFAVGLSIGTASHALGTSRALQLGETEGALSGLAIGAAGLLTALILSVYMIFI